MKSIKISAFFLLAILILIPLGPAHADAAPPMNPPGGDVSPEGGTQVQMVAEQVIIDFRQSTDDSAKVTAWFLFRNTGNTDENLKVRFPLNGDTRGKQDPVTGEYSEYTPLIKDFTAWIGDQKLPTQVIEDNDPNAALFFLGNSAVFYWAVFDMDFPVGTNVKLIVKYTLHPTEEASFAYVDYLMATGAGWKGPIGTADVILRLPYILNQNNFPSYNYIATYDQPGQTTTIQENQVWIHWDNLEPTDRDNVGVSIVQPHLWQQVLQWRTQVIATPDDASAWLNLARAYLSAGLEKHGMFVSDDLSRSYIQAFERALTLNPNNAALHIEFANGLIETDFNNEFYKATFLNEIATALKLDPDNAEALSILDMMQYNLADLPTPGPFPAISQATPTLELFATATSTPTPTRTSIPVPTFTLTPANTQTPLPTPTPMAALSTLFGDRSKGIGWFALSALGLLLGAVFVTWWTIKSKRE